ncbi:putative phosphoribosyl transferase [Limimonas halophila]|uniref:Putative phosphoribosyl transferase n=1 Tax=Limimonas halophila TaxID=1082479 RepID=A0A1G7M6V6_9PROT|nr:phosphoribosyltransferase family protein [Limimonas halophila]SDF57376.1 putative phosphoribosyl transferase [Limimonas halophila]
MFRDRADAGKRLAAELARQSLTDPVVIAMPRGGVPVGLKIARELGAPLDLVMVRKLGAPAQPELAMGAVARAGAEREVVTNREVIRAFGLGQDAIDEAVAREMAVIAERERTYLSGRTRPPIEGRSAIVVDDGIATGATARAAIRAVRRRNPAEVVLAVPLGPPDTIAAMDGEADRVVCLDQPEWFAAISMGYADFHQVGDREVVAALDEAARNAGEGSAG